MKISILFITISLLLPSLICGQADTTFNLPLPDLDFKNTVNIDNDLNKSLPQDSAVTEEILNEFLICRFSYRK